jgi:L-lactate utilization protein LutC
MKDDTRELARQKDCLPGAVTVISGVSRTADINLNITLGMHGPLELIIIVIGGETI